MDDELFERIDRDSLLTVSSERSARNLENSIVIYSAWDMGVFSFRISLRDRNSCHDNSLQPLSILKPIQCFSS